MNKPIIISQVLGRSVQGMTRPFICADESSEYFVKGDYAGKRSLCCEWLSHRLATILLPGNQIGLPQFSVAEASNSLIAGSARSDIRDLGEGKVFASLKIEGGQELTWSNAPGWPEDIMASLLLLDLWIQNEDRSLSELGGNPNLITTPILRSSSAKPEDSLVGDPIVSEKLWAYDFNLAFDPDFDRMRFFEVHVFGRMINEWPNQFRERIEPLLISALAEVPTIFSEIPVEWLHVDGDETLPVQLDLERVTSILELPLADPEAFWKLP